MDNLILFLLGSLLTFLSYVLYYHISRRKVNENRVIRFLKGRRDGRCLQHEILVSIGDIKVLDFGQALKSLYKKGIIEFDGDWVCLRK